MRSWVIVSGVCVMLTGTLGGCGKPATQSTDGTNSGGGGSMAGATSAKRPTLDPNVAASFLNDAALDACAAQGSINRAVDGTVVIKANIGYNMKGTPDAQALEAWWDRTRKLPQVSMTSRTGNDGFRSEVAVMFIDNRRSTQLTFNASPGNSGTRSARFEGCLMPPRATVLDVTVDQSNPKLAEVIFDRKPQPIEGGPQALPNLNPNESTVSIRDGNARCRATFRYLDGVGGWTLDSWAC